MARRPQINIINAFTWLTNVLDTQSLSSSEQLVLLHITKYLNRNFWKAINLSNHMLAKAIGKDDRTVKKALESLTKKNLIVRRKGEIFIGIEGANNHFSKVESESGGTDSPADAVTSPQCDAKPANVRNLANYL